MTPPSPWYKKIQREVSRRSKECVKDNDKEYHMDFDPYVYESVEDLVKSKPFNKSIDCKKTLQPVGKLDKYKRFYTDVNREKECKAVGGIWKKDSVSRINRVDKGTCWAKDDAARCATHEVQELLLPRNKVSDKGLISRSKKACNKDKGCEWVKLGDGYDCFNKGAIENIENRVMEPPESFPADVTAEGTERYLFDWYVNKKYGFPPSTSELIGQGNRCAAATTPKEKRYTASELAKMRPDRVPDNMYLREALGGKTYMAYLLAYQKDADHTLDWKTVELYPKPVEKDDLAAEEDMYNSKFKLSIPQSVVNMVMKNIAKTGSSNRGMLAWHSTGSGKTCTAAGVMDAFWDTGRQIVFASSIDAIASNPDYKFHECAMRLFPRFQAAPFLGKSEEDTQSKIASAFAARNVLFMSFAKLANRIAKTEKFKAMIDPSKKVKGTKVAAAQGRGGGAGFDLLSYVATKHPNIEKGIVAKALKDNKIHAADDYIDLDNAVLIIDEVHNLFRPLDTQKKQYKFVEAHTCDPGMHPNMKVVVLSATPGDNMEDTMKLINIVRDPSRPQIMPLDPNSQADIARFHKDVRGLISFFDMSADPTKFPLVIEMDHVRREMSDKQFEKYIDAYKAIKDSAKNYEALAKKNQLNKFWQGARKYSNMLFTFEKGMALTEFSSKLPALLQNINGHTKEKHYVYSSFYERRGSGQGIHEIARQLELQGYERLTVKQAKEANTNGSTLAPKKRYVIAVQSELSQGKTAAGVGKSLGELVKVFNQPENKSGDIVQVFLASQGFNEGIDLKAVRNIHMFEPLVTMASDMQTIGRARRYCSHTDLDMEKGEWTVKVFRYFSDFPKHITAVADPLIEKELEEAKAALDSIKGKRDKASTQLRKDIKAKIESLESKQPPKPKGRKRGSVSGQAVDIKNIDDFVFAEARQKMKQLFMTHLAMKEAAIDCEILMEFHNYYADDDKKVQCAFL